MNHPIQPINRNKLKRKTPTSTLRQPGDLKARPSIMDEQKPGVVVSITPSKAQPMNKIVSIAPQNLRPSFIKPPGQPIRNETWADLLRRVGDEYHGTASVQLEDGSFEERPVSMKEALIRKAFQQAMSGNAKVMTEILRRMPNPHTGLPEGDPPSVVEVSDWRTKAVRLIAEDKLSPQRAIQAFGIDLAAQLFNSAGKPFDRSLVTESRAPIVEHRFEIPQDEGPL